MSKYTNGDAVDIIENEGLEYAVRHYCDAGSFKDPQTVRLWDKAEESLTNLVNYLQVETGREVQ
jgi:hypothetical protein